MASLYVRLDGAVATESCSPLGRSDPEVIARRLASRWGCSRTPECGSELQLPCTGSSRRESTGHSWLTWQLARSMPSYVWPPALGSTPLSANYRAGSWFEFTAAPPPGLGPGPRRMTFDYEIDAWGRLRPSELSRWQ